MRAEFAREADVKINEMSDMQKSRMKVFGEKLYIGHEKREGWIGELPFYLFWCEACANFTKDYPHGHIERQYLNCAHCGAYHEFVPWWASLLELWQFIKFKFTYRG